MMKIKKIAHTKIITSHIIPMIILTALISVNLSRAKPAPPPPPPQQEPPPPSPEQIMSELRSALQPLSNAVNTNTGLPPNQHEGILNNLRSVKAKYSSIENGKIAIGKVALEIDELIKKARDIQRWGLVKLGIMAYDVLRPGATSPDGKYARLLERANLMIARPKVEVNGFLQAENDIYIFLTVTDVTTQKTENFKVREGEEFYEPVDPQNKTKKSPQLRVVRVIGDQQSVELLYIPANETWIVPGPKTKG
ncbi:MAG: hypothetical protein N3G21_07735 [Candidatus Hydrogenedentes bacterium]|nr:hypothetical protein [Candidatus Hydrogenedentota bacterium]